MTITSPSSGSTVSGTITVTASVTIIGDLTVAGVQFKLDGANLGAEDTSAPYSVSWNTTSTSNGSHTLTAVARDLFGLQFTSDPVTVTVSNDTSPPTITITSPSSGSTVAGTITVSASASDNRGVVGVQFRLDGASLGTEDTTAPYSVAWDTTTASNGSHTLTAVARDGAGNRTTSAPVTVTVSNGPPPDTTPPTVTISSPASGATVSGTITVSASASDNVGVAGVQFQLDGVALGAEDTTAPYAVAWDTTTASNGSHTLTAVARDGAGNRATSGPVTVTVSNDTTAPTVGLVGHWKFDEGSGTTAQDASGSGNTGTLVNGPVWTAAGKINGALNFDGGDDYVDAGSGASLDNLTSFTVAAWINPESFNMSQVRIADKESQTGTGWYFGMCSDNATFCPGAANTLFFTNFFTNQGIWRTAATTIALGTWQHVVVVYDRGSAANDPTFYINGTLSPTTEVVAPTGTPTNDSANNLFIGNRNPTNRGFDGSLDDVRIYNRALTAIEVAALFNAAVAAPPPPSDSTPPTVSITSPSSGAAVSGTVTVSASASDNVGVVGVQFELDGVALGAEDSTAPYSVAWDTTTVANGSHTLTARARDAAGNAASTAVTVTVSNAAPPTPTRSEESAATLAPAGAWSELTSAGAGVSLSGDRAVFAGAAGATATFTFTGTGVSWIGFPCEACGIARVLIDGVQVATVDTFAATRPAASGSMFSTGGLVAGSHTLVIEVTGTQNASSGNPFIIVDAFDVTSDGGAPPPTGDTTPPTVTISSPASGATVSGTITVSASASDNVGVVGVQFQLDGVALGAEDTTAPYSVAWDTTTTGEGSHTLTAVARDAAGNLATSAPVTVMVSNAAPAPPPATVTRFEETDLSITYTAGWAQGDTSRAWSGGTAAVSATPGAQATFTFTGPSVSWIGFRGPQTGIALVFLDGVVVAEVDTFSLTEEARVPVFTTTGLANAPHTLTIEVTGRKNAGSTSTIIVVDAFDVPAPTVTRVQETDPSITYAGAWAQGDATRAWSGGTVAFSTTAGAQATFTFTGTSVSWLGLRGPNTGIARVSLDGVFVADVDTFSPTDEVQAAVFTATGLADASHTLTIEVTGLKNAASTFATIVVDAFDVTSSGTRFQETDSSVTYTADGWIHGNRDRAFSGGTAAESITAGAQATFTFTGTSVSWLGFRGPQTGIARVSLDGVFVAEVDMFSTTEGVQATVFTATGLADASHTLTIEVTGRKNAASTNTWILVDAFDVK